MATLSGTKRETDQDGQGHGIIALHWVSTTATTNNVPRNRAKDQVLIAGCVTTEHDPSGKLPLAASCTSYLKAMRENL